MRLGVSTNGNNSGMFKLPELDTGGQFFDFKGLRTGQKGKQFATYGECHASL